jgi:predicted MFS family arabinose efflux permease
LLLSLEGVADTERGSVVGTFSSFFDLSQAVGAFVCGIVVNLSGNRGAFATGAVLSVLALVLLRSGIDPRTRAATDHGGVPEPVPEF